MRRSLESHTYLFIEDIDCSVPFFLQDMMFHDLLEIAYGGRVVKEDIRSTMAQY